MPDSSPLTPDRSRSGSRRPLHNYKPRRRRSNCRKYSSGARANSNSPNSAARKRSISASLTSVAHRRRSRPPRPLSRTHSSISTSPASPHRSPAALAHISFPSAAWSAAAGAVSAHRLCWDNRLAGPHLHRLRQERGGLPRIPSDPWRRYAARRHRDQLGRRRAVRPPRNAGFHRHLRRYRSRQGPEGRSHAVGCVRRAAGLSRLATRQ